MFLLSPPNVTVAAEEKERLTRWIKYTHDRPYNDRRDAVDGSKRGSDALRKAMRALSTLVQSVAEARNSIGDGHGSVNESPATPRHARLVFNSTVAVAQFIADTWHETSHEQKAALGSSF